MSTALPTFPDGLAIIVEDFGGGGWRVEMQLLGGLIRAGENLHVIRNCYSGGLDFWLYLGISNTKYDYKPAADLPGCSQNHHRLCELDPVSRLLLFVMNEYTLLDMSQLEGLEEEWELFTRRPCAFAKGRRGSKDRLGRTATINDA